MRPLRGGERGRPLGAPVLDGVAERPRDPQKPLQVEVDSRSRLLRDLVLDRQVEIVGSVVERPERVDREPQLERLAD